MYILVNSGTDELYTCKHLLDASAFVLDGCSRVPEHVAEQEAPVRLPKPGLHHPHLPYTD